MIREMLAADELYPTDPQETPRDRLSSPGHTFLFNRTTWLDEVVEHTGEGIPRADVQLREVPRPQVRSDQAGGLLQLPRDLRAVPGPH